MQHRLVQVEMNVTVAHLGGFDGGSRPEPQQGGVTVRWLLLSSLYRHLRSQLLLNAQLGSVPLGASALLMREVLNDGVKLLCRWQPGCWASCFISSRHKFGCVPEAARQTHFLFFPSSSTDFIPYVLDLFPVSISCAPDSFIHLYTFNLWPVSL